MNSAESIAVIEQLQRRFHRINKRFTESPALLQDWLEELIPFSMQAVEAGIKDWVRHHNSEPILSSLVDNIEKVAKQNGASRRGRGDNLGPADIMRSAAERQTSPDDLQWAMLHTELAARSQINKPTAESRTTMAEMYRKLSEELPSLKGDCLKAMENCLLEAAMIRENKGFYADLPESDGESHARKSSVPAKPERNAQRLREPSQRVDEEGPRRGVDGGQHPWDQPLRKQDVSLDETQGNAGQQHT